MESTTTELEQLTETAILGVEADGDHTLANGITETPFIRKAVSQPRLAVSSTPMIVEDRLSTLKVEFNRVVADQKAKRQEIIILKNELADRNQQIERLKTDENQALIELSMSKENAERLAIRLKNLERELEDCKNQISTDYVEQSPNKNSELLNKIGQLEDEIQNFRSNCDHLNETIRALEDERDSIEGKYRDLCKEMAELQQQFSNERNEFQQQINKIQQKSCMDCEKEKFLANETRQECTRLKDLYMKINDEKEEALRKMRQMEALDLNKQILELRNKVASLERSLQLAEMKYEEISKILEREKTDYEQQIQNLRTKYEQGK